MGLRNIIKNHLPVSSRSFHSDAEYMKEMLERMMHENAQLQRQLGAMGAELAQSRHEMVDLVINEHRHKKVHYLIGEAGFPNYGDELITREWLKYLAHVDPETPVVLDCMRPGPATALLRPYHPHFQATDTVARMTVENSFVEQAEVHRDIPVQDIANHVTGSLDEEGRARCGRDPSHPQQCGHHARHWWRIYEQQVGGESRSFGRAIVGAAPRYAVHRHGCRPCAA